MPRLSGSHSTIRRTDAAAARPKWIWCLVHPAHLARQLVHGAQHVKLDLGLLQKARPAPYAAQVQHHGRQCIRVLHLHPACQARMLGALPGSHMRAVHAHNISSLDSGVPYVTHQKSRTNALASSLPW